MKIELKDIKKEYKKNFRNPLHLISLFILGNIIVFVIFFFVLFTLFYLSYYLEPTYAVNELNHIINAVFYNWGWISLGIAIIFFCSYFVSYEERYRCEICNKLDYKDNMVVLNKAQEKKGQFPKCVCKSHNKPYVIPIKNNW